MYEVRHIIAPSASARSLVATDLFRKRPGRLGRAADGSLIEVVLGARHRLDRVQFEEVRGRRL